MQSIITTPFGEITQDTFQWIIFTPEEQWYILVQKFFGWNVFWVMNMIGRSVKNIRTIIRTDEHDFHRVEANMELDKLEEIFDSTEQLLSLFPKQ